MSTILGWDIGGAHLKLAELDSSGDVVLTEQYATPLWLGLDGLRQQLEQQSMRYAGRSVIHALTMTGELVDYFLNREEGVRQLLDLFSSVFPGPGTLVYAGPDGLLPIVESQQNLSIIASANWHATATYLATLRANCVLIDMGSTTTDLVLIKDGQLANRGYSDRQRMLHGELVYTGMIRTPVMAVVQGVEVDGQHQGVIAELFATMADVYRILGVLDEAHDLYPAADAGEKTLKGSLRRLAHMLGTDYGEELDDSDLNSVAHFIASEQIKQIKVAYKQITGQLEPDAVPDIVAAGIGRELLRPLASELHCNYIDLDCMLGQSNKLDGAADTAPAVAVAQLARQKYELQTN